jgi:hypothetical protein
LSKFLVDPYQLLLSKMEINSPGDHQHEDRLIGEDEIEIEAQWG